MSQRIGWKLAAVAALCGLYTTGGCATSPDLDRNVTARVPQEDWSDDWKKWEYPNIVGQEVSRTPPGALVLYEASTEDTFRDVLKHYEALSGIDGLSDPESPGKWTADNTGDVGTVVAYQSASGFTRHRGDRLPNDCSFLLRMPGYAVTAFIRQEPANRYTRITVLYESRDSAGSAAG